MVFVNRAGSVSKKTWIHQSKIFQSQDRRPDRQISLDFSRFVIDFVEQIFEIRTNTRGFMSDWLYVDTISGRIHPFVDCHMA